MEQFLRAEYFLLKNNLRVFCLPEKAVQKEFVYKEFV